jgi:hypothetical protein
MKKRLMSFLSLSLTFVIASVANAIMLTDTYYAPDDPKTEPVGIWLKYNNVSSISWQHNFTDDRVFLLRSIRYAEIELLFDDRVPNGGYDRGGSSEDEKSREIALLSFGGNGPRSWEADTGLKKFTVTSVTQFDTTGIFDVTLKISSGNIHFTRATMTVGVSTPEPTTVLLIGFGLLGVAALRRRFMKK